VTGGDVCGDVFSGVYGGSGGCLIIGYCVVAWLGHTPFSGEMNDRFTAGRQPMPFHICPAFCRSS